MEKIRGLFFSVEQVIKHAMKTGEILASKDTITKRLTICRECKYLEGNKCKICGCFMALKGGLSATNCPVKKW